MTRAGYEFHFSVDGGNRRYVIEPIYADDGKLQQFAISQDAPAGKPGQVINIEMDPAAFRQMAMPGDEVLSRIAIGQARQNKLFGAHSYREGIFLDFAIEPWEGELKPLAS
ncbi:MAG TPA: hypothetical protein VF472_02790 [Burkholderiaceae bacterium]